MFVQDIFLYFPRKIKFFFLGIITLKQKKYLHKNINFETGERYILFITHSLGGGTELFVTNFLKKQQGKNLLLMRNYSYLKDFYYTIEDINNKKKYLINSLDFILSCHGAIEEIIVNSLVSYYRWSDIIDYIISYKKNYSDTTVRYFVHDFHCICPSFNLIRNRRFCQIKCISSNCSFNKQVYTNYKTIPIWQEIWGRFLQNCDEVRCFSSSSKEILMKKYNNLLGDCVTVVPHSMEYFKKYAQESIQVQKDRLTIAIPGTILSVAKGCYIVKDFLKISKNKDFNVVIVGKLKKNCCVKAKNITYTGEYNSEELDIIFKKYNVNIVFFPSIWPETFSYLINEILFLGIPLVAFDIGAQGEKVKAYKKGTVISLDSPSIQIFKTIISAYNKQNLLSSKLR